MWKLGVILEEGLNVAPHKGEQKRRFYTKRGHYGWGRDSSGHFCPCCSLMHHRPHLAAWRTCMPNSSRKDIPVGEDSVGDTQQQHPQDPARAWVSPCVRLRARTHCCLHVCVQGGSAGLQYHRCGDGHSLWATGSPEIPVPGVGDRDGTSGSLAGGQPQLRVPWRVCWHKLLGSHFGSTKMCLSGNRFWKMTCSRKGVLYCVLFGTN